MTKVNMLTSRVDLWSPARYQRLRELCVKDHTRFYCVFRNKGVTDTDSELCGGNDGYPHKEWCPFSDKWGC